MAGGQVVLRSSTTSRSAISARTGAHPSGGPSAARQGNGGATGTRRADLKQLVTDKLRFYEAAHREVMPSVDHRQSKYLNNRAENSHQPTRQRERAMRGFRSTGAAQRFPVRVQRHLATLPVPPPPAVRHRTPHRN
jgi:hypothetical protein